LVVEQPANGAESPPVQNARPPQGDADLRQWLENMVGYHGFSVAEVREATGLAENDVRKALDRFNIRPHDRPARPADAPLTVLPYPGGRHPRIGFRDGAVHPQRETKVSVFTPWDPASYVVLDIPEAIWSHLGLIYLAHTHVPTIWTEKGVELERLEWRRTGEGGLVSERTLPNGIAFGTKVIPHRDHVQMEMWLTNGTDQKLADLRVQNCVLLKGAKGFTAQTNENKVFSGPYVACRADDGQRWSITAWDPLHRAWANAPCPCLHSDPKFPDCEPGQTQRLRGWLSFYEGTNIEAEIARIEATGWRQRPFTPAAGETVEVTGAIVDAQSGQRIPARLHIQGSDGKWHLAQTAAAGGSAVHYDKQPPNMPQSAEVHTTLSAHPFRLDLPPGEFTLRVERGKEYVPLVQRLEVGTEPVSLELALTKWIDMAQRGWYSGDTHVHRPLDELPNVLLAEDLNVALPLTYWVRSAGEAPADAGGQKAPVRNEPILIDATHVIHPLNTEYEIFSVGDRSHTLGAVFVLNHKMPLALPAPPVRPIAVEARRQGALLDLDKHSWPWSLMIVPIMDVDLFELANNHHWQTAFGFKQWTLEMAPEYMQLEMDGDGFTEWGWTDFGFQTYYALLNCGFPLRVTAGTASGVHPVQLGFGRVYVHLAGEFSYDEWIEGLDAGRSFVTTGPMLEVRFNGKDPGARFNMPPEATAAQIQVEGIASSAVPLDRIEIVVNGQISQTLAPANSVQTPSGYASRFAASCEVEESSWIAVRCFETHPDRRVRFAHSNPVYVELPGKPLRPRKHEVAYFVRRMQEEIARNAGILPPGDLAEYREALEVYQRLSARAK
jgi:hypothetical protein